MLSKVLIGILIAILGMGYWYYTTTQTRISILTENNAKLETAAMISEQSIKTLTQQAEKNQQLTIQLQTDLQKAEAYGDNLRQKLRELDLLADALKDAANLEGRMNGATAKLWRDFMESSLIPEQEVKIVTQTQKVTVPVVARPKPLQLVDTRVYVVNKDNYDQFVKDFTEENGELAYVALAIKDYENLALNIADIKRFIDQQNEIIIYYESAMKEGDEDGTKKP
jgi:hypothetical protein